MTVHRLRVEETPPPRVVLTPAAHDVPPALPASQPSPSAPAAVESDVEKWRRLAVQNGERLQVAEMQLRDLRREADEARARFGKYKGRLDAANARVNDLQVELTRVSADRDGLHAGHAVLLAEVELLRARLPKAEALRRAVYEYRQSLLEGPLWNAFAELCTDVSAGMAGEGSGKP